jgi:WD40 repeat protein
MMQESTEDIIKILRMDGESIVRISTNLSIILKVLSILPFFWLAGCARATIAVEPTSVPVRPTPSLTTTPSPTVTKTIWLTFTPRPTITPRSSKTPKGFGAPTLAIPNRASLSGTPLPAGDGRISEKNLHQLTLVGQWGRGTINRVAFAPNGSFFVVGSNYGIAVYMYRNLTDTQWIPFETSFYYNQISFSENSRYIKLGNSYDERTRRFIDLQAGNELVTEPETRWVISRESASYDDLTVISPDQTFRYDGQFRYEEPDETIITEDNLLSLSGKVIENLTNNQTNQIIRALPGETQYIYYEDYNDPVGCDVRSLGVCGNAYIPSAMTPFRGEFSNSNRFLAILYRPVDLAYSNEFSVLYIYDLRNKKIAQIFGNYDQPIEDFAFNPENNVLLIAFTNGSIQLWDATQSKMLFQKWNFNAASLAFDQSYDGKLLYLLQPGLLEVRRSSDGAVIAQIGAHLAAASPVDHRLAIGNMAGEIQILDMDTMETVARMEGHSGPIYNLTFSPDGQTLLSSSQDCSLRSWNATTGQFEHYFEKVVVDPFDEHIWKSRIFVYNFQFIPNTNQVVGFGSFGTAVSWNLHSGAVNYVTESEALEYYDGMVTLNPHFPESFWVVPEEGRFYINQMAYDLNSGEAIGPYEGMPGQVEDCAAGGPVTADGKVMFTRGYDSLSGKICVLDAQSLQIRYLIPAVEDIGGLYLSPDGKRLYAPTRDGTVLVYQVMP